MFAGEVRDLQEQLAKATAGQGFLLMDGRRLRRVFLKEFNIKKVRGGDVDGVVEVKEVVKAVLVLFDGILKRRVFDMRVLPPLL